MHNASTCSRLLAARETTHWQNGPGWRPLLQSKDFGEWESAVANSLGHHRSRLVSNSLPFEASIRCSSVDEFSVLLLQGRGQVELLREQVDHAVLWMPLQGLSQETINGTEHLAEPGMALLFRPGDEMCGLTSEEISGVSILLPAQALRRWGTDSPLLYQGTPQRALIKSAWALVASAALQPQGAAHAAEAFVDALHRYGHATGPNKGHERVTARRRRELLAEAAEWMEQHLATRFSVEELSKAMEVPIRTLQDSFQRDLGCTPMALAKRLRLQRLRLLLQDPEFKSMSIAGLTEASGLLACGVTARDYRRWCGETPRRTREQAMAGMADEQ